MSPICFWYRGWGGAGWPGGGVVEVGWGVNEVGWIGVVRRDLGWPEPGVGWGVGWP